MFLDRIHGDYYPFVTVSSRFRMALATIDQAASQRSEADASRAGAL